jgi:sulfite oxidase
VLLADRMNGSPLEPVHGAPLRVLVPGYIGARSVKWLTRITAQAEPSANYFQRKAYRLLPPGAAPGAEEGPMLGEFPINVIVTSPAPDAKVTGGRVEVVGVALVGGGRHVARVEVSGDGGGSWVEAGLERRASRWSWTRFRATVSLAPGAATIVARAWDDAGSGQPAHPAETWNAKGYQNNAWYRVVVEAV